MLKSFILEELQNDFANRNEVGYHIDRASNVTDEEGIMNIAPIPSFLVYYGLYKYLDAETS